MSKKNIIFENFKTKKNLSNKKKDVKKILSTLLKENNHILYSLGNKYKDSFNKILLSKLKKKNTVRLIGMGGSILGSKAIYNFLQPKSKKFLFIDNLSNFSQKPVKKGINLIISKSGNTLETICNSNTLINKRSLNIFLTEKKQSYLTDIANRLKAEIVHHNNFIGGRYSVLSEVGMLPAQLMGLNPKKFRKFNQLIKKESFVNSLIMNVSSTLIMIKKNITNSIILNYDYRSNDLFSWYQQLVAESLGKKNRGILPIISIMPRDNHSSMQYYLDGVKNHFFTFFFVKEKNSLKIKNHEILKSHLYLKNKNLNSISFSQFSATKRIFDKKNIPFRSFVIQNRNEEALGELFTFFILETILLGKAMGINPYDQPAVELIKKETKKDLINS